MKLWLQNDCHYEKEFYHAMFLGKWIIKYCVQVSYYLNEGVEVSTNYVSGFIENDVISTIVHWMVGGVIGMIFLLIYYAVPVVIISGGSFLYLRSEKFDKIARWLMVGSAILFVAVASKSYDQIPINLILLWFVIQVAVPMIRYLIFPGVQKLIYWYQNLSWDEKRNMLSNIMMLTVLGVGAMIFVLYVKIGDVFIP